MPVHFGGLPCEMNAITDIARSAGLAVVEDAAHAFGSTYHGRPVGTLGDLAAFSFGPIKNITCGEGGAVATDSDDYAERIRLMRNLGIDRDGWTREAASAGNGGHSQGWGYAVSTIGFRYHLPHLNAALGLTQLGRYDQIRARKRQVVEQYDAAFRDRDGLALLVHDLEYTFPFFYVLRVLGGRRDALITHLATHGVGSAVHYIPNHLQPLFAAGGQESLPITERLFGEILTLPLFADITDTEVETVVSAVESFSA